MLKMTIQGVTYPLVIARKKFVCIHCLSDCKRINYGLKCGTNQDHYGFIKRDEAVELTEEERYMLIGKMFPSDWLRGIDIPQPIKVIVESITPERVKNYKTGKMEDIFVMRFKGMEKKLRLNKTMVMACLEISGYEVPNTDAFIGMQVTVYKEHGVFFGKPGLVPRIRKPQNGDVDYLSLKNGAAPKPEVEPIIEATPVCEGCGKELLQNEDNYLSCPECDSIPF